jgi:hypothetical protein
MGAKWSIVKQGFAGDMHVALTEGDGKLYVFPSRGLGFTWHATTAGTVFASGTASTLDSAKVAVERALGEKR